jgi:hypothetical protein
VEETKDGCRIFVRKTLGEPLGRPRNILDNIIMVFKEVDCEDRNYMQFNQENIY